MTLLYIRHCSNRCENISTRPTLLNILYCSNTVKTYSISKTRQCMPSRSTICLSWTSAFNVHFLTVIVRFVPGEVHLGYVMTGCGVLCTCIFACGDIRWSYLSSSLQDISFYTDGHFLLCLLCPFTLTFQLDSHGLIDKLFPFTGSPESVDTVKHTVFL